MNILLDSNIMIEYLRKKPEIRRVIDDLLDKKSVFYCCDITVGEIMAGMRPNEKQATFDFLRDLPYLPTRFTTAVRAGLIKKDLAQKGKTISLVDAIIAAVAIEHHCELMTLNLKDFQEITGLNLVQHHGRSG